MTFQLGIFYLTSLADVIRAFLSFQEAYTRAKAILYKRSKEHKRLAEALLKYETLDAEEVKLVIQGRSLQNK